MTDTRRASSEVLPGEQSIIASRRGLPGWMVVVLALALSGAGASIDLARGSSLSPVFTTLYALGCVLAVLAVRRRALFTAAVQPPLVLVVTVPLAALLFGGAGSTGLRGAAIALALPLVDGFPAMAVTTAVVLVITLLRVVLHRRSTPAGRRGGDTPVSAVAARAAAAARPASRAAERSAPTGERSPARTIPDRTSPTRTTADRATDRPTSALPRTGRGVGDPPLPRDRERPSRTRRADAPGEGPAPRRAAPGGDRGARVEPRPEARSEPRPEPRFEPRARRSTPEQARPEPRRFGPAGTDSPDRPARPRDDLGSAAPRPPGTRLPPLRQNERPARVEPPLRSSTNDRYWRREQ